MQEPSLKGMYVLLIVQARSYDEVAALLQSAVSQGAADVVATSAAFDRLRALHASSKRGRREELQAAFQLALQDALQRLPEATPRSLSALARAAYHLDLPVPQEEHRGIVAKFVGLVRALQDRHAPMAKPVPAPPKPGWVQFKLSKPGASGRLALRFQLGMAAATATLPQGSHFLGSQAWARSALAVSSDKSTKMSPTLRGPSSATLSGSCKRGSLRP